MSAKPSFFAELKRRNVLRAGVLYAGAVWALAQGIAQLGPPLGAPGWITRWFVIAACIGFPFWLAFAWFYEFTPQGLKRESEIAPGDSIAGTTGRKLDKWIIAVLAVAVVLLLTNTFVWHKGAGPGAGTTSAITSKSIAVLAFADMSPNRDQGYFSDGMSEEILNALAQVNDLKVAGRTSSFYYKNRNEDLRAIGKALGVANILEGSVRKQGNEVRITAQLIRVADDTHLWSHAYDGDLSDVFKLQEDIARAITDQLKVVLVGAQKTSLVRVATTNTEAYNLYLKATEALNQRDYARMGQAIGWLQQAIKLDPDFARAQSRLAIINALGQSRYGASRAEVEPHARAALALDPGNAEAEVALSLLARQQRRALDARAAQDRALALAPNDAAVNLYAGQLMIVEGYTRQGIAHLDRALAIDPKLPNALYWRARQYAYAGDLDSAQRLNQQARDLGLSFAVYGMAQVAILRGDLAQARALLLPAVIDTAGSVDCPKSPRTTVPIYLDGVLGGNAAARTRAVAVLEDCLADKPDTVPSIVPFGLMRLDEPAQALAAAASAPTSDDAGFFMALWGTDGRAARRLPEFAGFARKVGLAALWDKYGPSDLCRKSPSGDYVCE